MLQTLYATVLAFFLWRRLVLDCRRDISASQRMLPVAQALLHSHGDLFDRGRRHPMYLRYRQAQQALGLMG